MFNHQSDGVCAQVVLQINQDVVQERDAFQATLVVSNGSALPLTSVDVSIQIFDTVGNDVTSTFTISAPTLTDLSGVDGDGEIGAGADGKATWTIIPTRDAAGTSPVNYFASGHLSYLDNGVPVNVDLQPATITVLPQPELFVDYFWQRDVFGDDPFTTEVEPSQPFELDVIVNNQGAGTAHDLRIDSAQPQIIDNDKGLLINFQIIATQIFGEDDNLTPSLTANLGELAPDTSKIARWLMTSTLQGLFINYDASFLHESDSGDERLSLIREVNIHELIHSVLDTSSGADSLPDFLTNEVADPNDLPDTLFFSNGGRVPVTLFGAATFDHAPSLADLQVHMTVAAGTDWQYLTTTDPGNGQYLLAKVIRSDGVEVPIDNFWQTDRTFVGGGNRPIYEDNLHMLDNDSTGSYTLYYSPIVVPLVPPVVVSTQVQGGLTERSFVDTAAWNFDRQMNLAQLIADGSIVNAVSLTNFGIDADSDPDQAVPLSASQFHYDFDGLTGLSRLTWSLDSFAFATTSVADGSYQLTLDASLIKDLAGNSLDGNGNGTGGDNFALSFHRLQGDVDGNRVVDAADMNVVNAVLGATPSSVSWNANADLDRDSRITVRDRVLVARATGNQIVPPISLQELAAVLPGDFNLDDIVDSADYVVWRRNLGRTSDTPFSAGDATGDGAVDNADYLVWRQNFGKTRASLAAQPGEPQVIVTLIGASAIAAESQVTLLSAVAAASVSDEYSDRATRGEFRPPAIAVARDAAFMALTDGLTVNATPLRTLTHFRPPAFASSMRSIELEPFASKPRAELYWDGFLAATCRPVYSESSAPAVATRADTVIDQVFGEDATLGGGLTADDTDWLKLAGMRTNRKLITN